MTAGEARNLHRAVAARVEIEMYSSLVLTSGGTGVQAPSATLGISAAGSDAR